VGKITFKGGQNDSPPRSESKANLSVEPISKRKLIPIIIARLDADDWEVKHSTTFLKVNLPDYMMEQDEFRNLFNDMSSPFFWLQKALITQKDGKIDMCVSYYLNALRHTPTSAILMFNLANSYKKLGKL
jgi:hypothetical protein